jgi:hypothetical protein
MRQLTKNEVEFTAEIEQEYTSVRGNVMATDDDVADKAAEDEIIDRLKRDDYSAWCSIMVKAEWNGHKGIQCLGCVSLAETNTGSECQRLVEEFAEDAGMYEQALEDLNENIANYVANGKKIESELS